MLDEAISKAGDDGFAAAPYLAQGGTRVRCPKSSIR